MEELAIRVEGVVQRRKHFQLGPVQLRIPKGYVTALVGPNGSGKSSLFRLLMDLSKPDEGEIEVFGHPIGCDDLLLKQRIGYVPDQAIDIEDHLRAEDKASFARHWYPTWELNRYQELLRRFEVDPSIKLGRMSKGMRRKFDIALAMAHHPDLLLLDEPSSGLDPIAWKTMIDVIHRYMERGDRTVLMASHIVDEVKRLADYIVFIVHGRVLGMFEKDALLESWYTLYIDGAGRSLEWKAMPGFYTQEAVGSGQFKVVTGDVAEAEEWCEREGLRIAGRQKLELDDILAILIEQERLRMQA
ncbi:ABC-2 type transport system ATP-binding protein [Paenibacillus phyllosphaerae]|uniref:ABC-2 type transport system ATP-binding protein n=1 Tax=Paenibacillus phyllosphaerae TaxID=274593 RepID=A0A7W5B511_9BACL|nr:ABC transporter ATP-binding protein [Paenibacillus phyllosphaerae]MBB3114545.1 ABC-2 type transport system ATP-binding protein [Paenibacillus phyllosphaerae]